jgi:hypothetical protein
MILQKLLSKGFLFINCKIKGRTLGGLAATQTPTLLKIKAKPWALPKPTREIISLDPY